MFKTLVFAVVPVRDERHCIPRNAEWLAVLVELPVNVHLEVGNHLHWRCIVQRSEYRLVRYTGSYLGHRFLVLDHHLNGPVLGRRFHSPFHNYNRKKKIFLLWKYDTILGLCCFEES